MDVKSDGKAFKGVAKEPDKRRQRAVQSDGRHVRTLNNS
jgi:hypothetical protein